MTPSLTDQQRQASTRPTTPAPLRLSIRRPKPSTCWCVPTYLSNCRGGRGTWSPRNVYPEVDRVMADDDANDPFLASYQDGVRPQEPT